jgi:subtilisin family serine protease
MHHLARYLCPITALLLLLGFGSSARSQSQAQYQGHAVAPNEVLVKLRQPPTALSMAAIYQAGDIDSRRGVGSAGILLIHSRSKSVAELIQTMRPRPEVEYVEPNYALSAAAIPNDPLFPNLWGLRNTGQPVNGVSGKPGADIGASDAWDISRGGTDNVIGIIDTGIDCGHPDLTRNCWSAPSTYSVTIGGQTITCQAGTHGFNAITKSCDPMDDNDHGTHVSGTCCADGNNGTGVVGVNWRASIIAAKFLDSNGHGWDSDAIDAIDYLIQTKNAFASSNGANVRVMSNSWGGTDFSQALLDAINRANANDILFVAAAGNNGGGNTGSDNDIRPIYPCNYNAPNVVCVAATDSTDTLASFSNYGRNTVHLAAPGVSILSTVRGSYAYYSGTSMATPHVAGAAALILSVCQLTTASLKNTLLNNVDTIASLSNNTVTGGRLNVARALRACAPSGTPTSLWVSSTGPMWASTPFNPTSNQTGIFIATADATPQNATTDAAVALSSGPQSAYTGLACIVRFNTSGYIDVRNGGTYTSDAGIRYTAGLTYRIRFEVDVQMHTYTVYVTSPDGTETRIALNYAFRTEQNGVASLSYFTAFADVGSMQVSNLAITSETAAAGYPWINLAFAAQTDTFVAQWDAVPSDRGLDGVMALSSNPGSVFTDFAVLVRFAGNGQFDARNGGVYSADQAVPYVAGGQYHVRVVVSPQLHTYSVFVTPPGGTEIQFASNYAFRTEQAGTASLANFGVIVDSTFGSVRIFNLSIG